MTDGDAPNPYASPTADALPSAGAPSEDFQIAALRAFVGPNANYYLRQWSPLLSASEGKVGFNWAAFFFSGVWLLYRKMYKFAAIFFAAVVVETVVEVVLFVGLAGQPQTPAGLDSIIGIGVAALCGAFGNRWYFRHAQNSISHVRSQGYHDALLLDELSRRGGRSLLSAVGLFFVFFLVLFAAMLLLEIIFTIVSDQPLA